MSNEKPPIRRKRFEVKTHIDPFTGNICKDVFVDDKLFEWELDQNSFEKVCKMGAGFAQAAQIDVLRHFCESMSEFLGRKVAPGEIIMAFKTGWI